MTVSRKENRGLGQRRESRGEVRARKKERKGETGSDHVVDRWWASRFVDNRFSGFPGLFEPEDSFYKNFGFDEFKISS